MTNWDLLFRETLDSFYLMNAKDPNHARIQICALFAGAYAMMDEEMRGKALGLLSEVVRQFKGATFEDLEDLNSFVREKVQE